MSLSWDRVGKKVATEDLNQAEVALGVSLPMQFRAFLLKTNGGVPKLKSVGYGWNHSFVVSHICDLSEVIQVTRQYRSAGLPVGVVKGDAAHCLWGEATRK